jgi:alkylation response protein AidB-like acyl-CoA dehydrogenase
VPDSNESHAGSDVTAMHTTLEAERGDYDLNGRKTGVSAVEDGGSPIIWPRSRTTERAHGTGDPPGRLLSGAARLFASDSSERIVSEAVQVYGANGY